MLQSVHCLITEGGNRVTTAIPQYFVSSDWETAAVTLVLRSSKLINLLKSFEIRRKIAQAWLLFYVLLDNVQIVASNKRTFSIGKFAFKQKRCIITWMNKINQN
jgi:hypothetical protein